MHLYSYPTQGKKEHPCLPNPVKIRIVTAIPAELAAVMALLDNPTREVL